MSVMTQGVTDIVKEEQLKHGVLEKKEVTSKYFGTVVIVTGVKLNSNNT